MMHTPEPQCTCDKTCDSNSFEALISKRHAGGAHLKNASLLQISQDGRGGRHDAAVAKRLALVPPRVLRNTLQDERLQGISHQRLHATLPQPL